MTDSTMTAPSSLSATASHSFRAIGSRSGNTGAVGHPIWVDEGEFDIGYHIRRSALPKPGTDEQLHELVARVMSRPLSGLWCP
jgi:hypothetical protein